MKDLKTLSLVTLLAFGVSNASAVVVGPIDPGGSTSADSPSRDGGGVGRAQEPDATWSPPDMQECSPKSINGELSMGLLKGILEPGKNVKVEKLPNNEMRVDLPPYVTACLTIKPHYSQVGNNVFVHFKSDKEITFEDAGYTDENKAEFEKLDWEQKYYSCMINKGYLKKNGSGNYVMDRDKAFRDRKIKRSGLSEYPPFKYSIPDTKDSVEVYVMSPAESGAGDGNMKVEPQSLVGDYPSTPKCMEFTYAEGKGQISRLYTSARDEVYDKALKVCEEENAEAILRELSRLKGSTAGNYNDLISILEKAYGGIKEDRVKQIYTELERIQEDFKTDKDMSEGTAEEKAEEYAEYVRELSRLVITPNAEKINELMKDDPKANYDTIQKLGREIAEFNEFNSKKEFNPMYEKLKEFGLTNEFRTIEGTRLASENYARVYKGKKDKKRGSPLTLKQATREIENKLEKLDDVMFDWDADYATKNGSKAPIYLIRARTKDRKERMDRDYKRFMRREQSNAQKYCANNMLGQMRNPTRCRSWMAGKNRRMQSMLRRRGRDLQAIRKNTGRYSKYMTNYNDYLDAQEEENYAYDPYGMYGGGRDLYRDYDFYGNADDYSDDFGWNFNMQNNRSVFPGMQPQQRNPAAFSPMGQQPNPFMMGPNPYATPFN